MSVNRQSNIKKPNLLYINYYRIIIYVVGIYIMLSLILINDIELVNVNNQVLSICTLHASHVFIIRHVCSCKDLCIAFINSI